MRTKKGMFLLLLIGLLLAACANQMPQEAVSDRAGAEAPMEMEVAEDDLDRAFYAGEGAAAQPNVQEQLIIRTAEMAIVVENTDQTMEAIAALAEAESGWVVRSNVYQRSDNALSGTITIRVPVDRFRNTMNAIEEMALEVTRASQESEDVTEEYVDLRARLQNLEATAERVRGFLDEADDVEEALAVNQELSRLESEIEALKGRIQYLEQSAAFSTITVDLTPDELSQPIEVAGWRPTGIVRDAVETLIRGLQFLATALIWLVVAFLPLALIVLLPLIALLFFVRRRWRARRSSGEGEAA